MKIERPQFELTRVYADGTSDAPEIVPVSQMPWDTQMQRRGFLGVGIGVASVLALSCGQQSNKSNDGPDTHNIINAHAFSVNALAISPDGKTLVSGSFDETIKLWSLPEGRLLTTFKGHKKGIYALAISPDGKTLVSGSVDETIMWSLPEGKFTFEHNKMGIVNSLAISPDGQILASGSADDTIKLWSLPEGRLLTTLKGHENRILALAISPDGKTLVSGSNDETIKLWSLPEGNHLTTLKENRGSVNALVISSNSMILASGSTHDTIKLWSLPEGRLLTTLKGHKDGILALAISPDGKTLVSSSQDTTIKLWSFPDGNLLNSLGKYTLGGQVQSLAISPDGKTLASGYINGVIILWDLEKRSFLGFLGDPTVILPKRSTDSLSNPSATPRTQTTATPDPTPVPRKRSRGTPHRHSSGGGGGCTCNKVCTCIPVPSDRNVKEAFETTDPLLILQRLSQLPIQTWNYKWNDAAIRHIGPMAQDFAAAFAVGEDDKHICPVDAQGVAFAAIQGLYRIVKEKDAQTESLQVQLQNQQEENQELKARIEALERLIKPLA